MLLALLLLKVGITEEATVTHQCCPTQAQESTFTLPLLLREENTQEVQNRQNTTTVQSDYNKRLWLCLDSLSAATQPMEVENCL